MTCLAAGFATAVHAVEPQSVGSRNAGLALAHPGVWSFGSPTYIPFPGNTAAVDLITSLAPDATTPVTYTFASGHAPVAVVGTGTPARVNLAPGTYTVTGNVSNGAIITAPHTLTIQAMTYSDQFRDFQVPAVRPPGLIAAGALLLILAGAAVYRTGA